MMCYREAHQAKLEILYQPQPITILTISAYMFIMIRKFFSIGCAEVLRCSGARGKSLEKITYTFSENSKKSTTKSTNQQKINKKS